MPNVGINGTVKRPFMPPCSCGRPVVVRYAQREGEGEHPGTGELCGSTCIEAWIHCEHCGWVSPLMDVRCWSDERFDGDTPSKRDIRAAVDGACVVWRERCLN